MGSFSRAELAAVYIADEGLLTFCDMLSAVPQDDWPSSQEDLSWLLWAFGADPLQ